MDAVAFEFGKESTELLSCHLRYAMETAALVSGGLVISIISKSLDWVSFFLGKLSGVKYD